MYITYIMWYRNTYRFSPFYKSIGKIVIKNTWRSPVPPQCVDHKYDKSLKSLARVQLGINKKEIINKTPNKSNSG